jgi:voltage-gated sodium channel
MVFKMTAHGPINYFSDWFRCGDFCIVVIALIEIGLPQTMHGIAVLRSFRILRVLKIIEKVKKLKDIIVTINNSASDAATLGLLIAMFVFINALVGKQLFGNEILKNSRGEPVRLHFQTVKDAMFTVFICLTGKYTPIMRVV